MRGTRGILVLLAAALFALSALLSSCGAKSGLLVAELLVVCEPDEVYTSPGRTVDFAAEVEASAGVVAEAWQQVSGGAADLTARGRSASATPENEGDFIFRFTVEDGDGRARSCETLVHSVTGPPIAICPDTIETTPLTTVELEGGGFDDGEVVSHRWEMTSIPPGSAAEPPSPLDEPTTRFTPDIAGEYRFRLTVVDDDGREGTCDLLVLAIAEEGLRIEVSWNGPDDRSCGAPRASCSDSTGRCDPTDVDLHLLRPGSEGWFDGDGDCYFRNCSDARLSGWGDRGSRDDPRLDIDDVCGFGPENINIREPTTGAYRVGVDFWEGQGVDTADVTVRIFCGRRSAAPTAVFGPVRLSAAGPQELHDFWRVADVVIGGPEACRVIDLAEGGAPDLITHDEANETR